MGPAFDSDAIVGAVRGVLDLYVEQREADGESFVEFYRRVGIKPIKERLYARS